MTDKNLTYEHFERIAHKQRQDLANYPYDRLINQEVIHKAELEMAEEKLHYLRRSILPLKIIAFVGWGLFLLLLIASF